VTVFDAAMRTIYADRNMAADALHYPCGSATAAPVRVVRSAPDGEAGWNGGRVAFDAVVLEVRVAELPAVARGDVFQIGAARFTVQGEPRRDAERLIWTVEARPE
jgi:hypothetical protein